MTKILLLGDPDPRVAAALTGFELIPADRDTLDAVLAEHAADIPALVTRGRIPVTAGLIARLPKLELISNFGVGYDSVDCQAAAQAGVVVTNTPDVLNDEMADFTVGLLLATIRRIPHADRHVREGHWAGGQNFPLSASLRGRHIGIAGLGRIGKVIARRLSGFDLPISVYGRRAQPDHDFPYHRKLVDLARAVDTLIVVLPGGPETRNVVDAEVLQALGPEGVFINVARGSVVDEEALIDALRNGTILAAGLDVFADEPRVPEALHAMENVVLLPHIGTATQHTRGLMAALAAQNIVSWFAGNGPVTPVAETPVPARAKP
ncbi:MAG: 2-hydroxyacid dehydrogenase [Rhodospirillales bacterium 20-64-7]|nr:MAG: 2-hydroxyacid dehydrogenase [Rhodospirillales bacterium 20-64-7]